MYPTTEAALAALSAAGWTEIDNHRVGTFAARGGTLAVLTKAPDGGDGFTITAITFQPMPEAQAAKWQKDHPGEGVAPFAAVGAKTGALIPIHVMVRGEDGSARVFWNPQSLDNFDKDGPEDNTAEDNTAEDATQDTTQPMTSGERLAAAMAEPASYHHAQHTMTTLKAFMAAGYTRDEAFEMVLATWVAMNQHQADHCIEGTQCRMERPQDDTDGED